MLAPSGDTEINETVHDLKVFPRQGSKICVHQQSKFHLEKHSLTRCVN